MQEYIKQKQCSTHFDVTHAKTTVQTQWENQNQNINECQLIIQTISIATGA